MNKLPPSQGVSNISDQYGKLADPRDLAALIMIESQDSIYKVFEDGMVHRTLSIERLNIARQGLVVALAYELEAQSNAKGKPVPDDTVVVVEAEDAEQLHDSLADIDPDQQDADGEQCENEHEEESSHTEPQPYAQPEAQAPVIPPSSEEAEDEEIDEITDSYQEGENWELNIRQLRFSAAVLSDQVKTLGHELSIIADKTIKFLEESEDSIQKINQALRQTEIDPSWLETLTDENSHFEVKEFLRRIEETRSAEIDRDAKKTNP